MKETVKLILLVLAISIPAIAQTPRAIEKELITHVIRIGTLAEDRSTESAVKLDAENDALKAKLVKFGKFPSTLKYPFTDLRKHLDIATSKDGKFRIFSWDTRTGGTMHFFENVYQFQGGDGKTYSKAAVLDESDAGGFYSDIFQVPTRSGTVYIGRLTAILSTKDSYEEVALFRIDRTTLDDRVRLFKTKAGLQDHIGFEYNFFSVVDRKERPIKLIQFDEKSNTVKIPIVISKKGDEAGVVTKRFIKYKFDGTYFVNVR
jgi:hypothetical protein